MIEQAAIPQLQIENLQDRHDGVSDGVALMYAEAARVCLDRHHQSPIEAQIDSSGHLQTASLEWVVAPQRLKNAHANEIDATEAGACACVLAAVELAMQMVAIHRAETLTGADYYIAAAGSSPADLEHVLRLEISGVDRGPPAAVRQRLNTKLDQAAKGASNLPALAGVVGFKAKLIMIERVPER